MPSTLHTGTPSILNGLAGDFNGDGHVDVMMCRQRSMQVAWNSSAGLGAFETFMTTEGQWTGAFWDEDLKVLWCTSRFPDQVEAWSLAEGVPKPLSVHAGHPRSARLSPAQGLTVLGRSGPSIELLDANGDAEVITPDGSRLEDAAFLKDNRQTDILIMQDAANGRVGYAARAESGWSDPTWWEQTERCENLQVHLLPEGGVQMMGLLPSGLCYQELDAHGEPTVHWQWPLKNPEVDFWLGTASDTTITFIQRSRITFSMLFITADRRDGTIIDAHALDELDRTPILLPADLDGDGRHEVIHCYPDGSDLKVHAHWMHSSGRLAWLGEDASAGWSSPMMLDKLWLNALGDMDGVEEIWMHQGGLYFKRAGQWQCARPNPEAPSVPLPQEQSPETGWCHQLVVPYLELPDGVPQWTGMAEVTPREWHHLVFIRERNLHTEIWLDGTCLFEGSSADNRYFYNALVMGSSYGTGHRQHAAVTLDRILLAGKTWTVEDILAEYELREPADPRAIADSWSFEEMPYRSDVTERDVEVVVAPRWTEGVTGKGVSFDGVDDAMRTYTAVPDDITLSFHFRLDDASRTELQSLLSLYGMYNTSIAVKWAPRSKLLQSDSPDGTVRSPQRVVVGPSGWPDRSSPFVLNGMLHLLDSVGQVLEKGPLGWQPTGEPFAGGVILGHPWIVDNTMHVLDDDGRVWNWTSDRDWDFAGRSDHGSFSRAIAGTEGAFLESPGHWTWLPAPLKSGYKPTGSAESLAALYWTPFGDFAQLGQDPARPWHPTLRTIPMEVLPAPFTPWPIWLKAFIRLLILVPVLILVGWLVRSKSRPAAAMMDDVKRFPGTASDFPPLLSDFLHALMPFAGQAIETEQVDRLLKMGSDETDETRRARRAKFIRESNEWSQQEIGLDLISRERNPKDRRRTLYVIHEAFGGS